MLDRIPAFIYIRAATNTTAAVTTRMPMAQAEAAAAAAAAGSASSRHQQHHNNIVDSPWPELPSLRRWSTTDSPTGSSCSPPHMPIRSPDQSKTNRTRSSSPTLTMSRRHSTNAVTMSSLRPPRLPLRSELEE